MGMGFIEQNESGDKREAVLEGIIDIEKKHQLNKLTIDEIVRRIAQKNVLEDSLVTIIAQISTSYTYFKHICRRASIEKLEELVDHPNYVVQCYAFVALTQKAPDKIYNIIMSKLHITAKIKTLGFDIGGRVRVADFIIYEGLRFLTAKQYDNIAEEVFKNNYNLDFISNYFRELKPKEEHYKRVKKYVTEIYNPDALQTLAKFKKLSDLEIIKSFSQEESWEFYKAVKIFPHPSFWNILLKLQKKGLENKEFYPPNLKGLYEAIYSYHNIEVIELLTSTFDKIINRDFVKYHAEAIFHSVKDFKDGFYDNLLIKLWRDYNQINLEIFDYLLEKFSDTSLELIILSVSDPDKLYKLISNTYNFKNREKGSKELTEKMIGRFIAEDKDGAFNAIKINILKQNVNYLPIFTKIVTDLSNDEFIEVLFERFTTDKNYHVYTEIAKCILDYNSPKINIRLLKVFKSKSYLRKSWELKEILKPII